MWSNSGDDYTWTMMKISASDLNVEEDFKYGESSPHPFNGPSRMKMFNDRFLVTAGAIMDSTHDAI